MKILCSKSGIHFTCEHFPAYIHSRETHHPIFDISQKELIQYIKKWASNELTETDSYLYYLALLNSTSLVQWRVPAQKTEITKSLIANNMDYLIQTISKMNCITSPVFKPAFVAISPETKTLENSMHWIHMWNESADRFVSDYSSAFADERMKERINARETILYKLLHDPNKPESIVASHLAEWADDAGGFPTHLITINGRSIQMNEYWKEIIRACVKSDAMFAINDLHLDKLLEYCEENIDAGSVYGHRLFKFLRRGEEVKQAFSDFADVDLTGMPKFRILDASSSVEDANKLAMIDSAPLEEPKSSNYPDKISYLRAKAKYDLARNYRAALKESQSQVISNSNLPSNSPSSGSL